MKYKSYILLFIISILAISLSACVGVQTDWPGLSADEQSAYVAFNNHVYAVNLDDGTQKWRYPVEQDNTKTFFASPALSPDGQLIVGGYDSVLYSLNPETGGPTNWNFPDAENRYIASALATEEGELRLPPGDPQEAHQVDLFVFGHGPLEQRDRVSQQLWIDRARVGHHHHRRAVEVGRLLRRGQRRRVKLRADDQHAALVHVAQAQLDIGCLHSVPAARRGHYAAEVARLSRPDTLYMLYAFQPSDRHAGRGISPDQVRELLGRTFVVERQEGGEDPDGPGSFWYWLRRRHDDTASAE